MELSVGSNFEGVSVLNIFESMLCECEEGNRCVVDICGGYKDIPKQKKRLYKKC